MGRLLGVCLIWAVAMVVVAQLQGFHGCVEEERVGLLALSPVEDINTSGDCCQWVGVNCSASTGRVERLSLYELRYHSWLVEISPFYKPIVLGSSLNISLFLPFQELLVLNLSSCNITGLLHQADFVKIRSLKYLDISSNSLNINLQDVFKMNNIIELNLARNSITGPLPDCVGNMTKLQILNLDDNKLSGNIPPTIGNLSHLRYLSLSNNLFEGSFSLSSLASNSKLQFLALSPQNNNLQLETETPIWSPSFQLKVLLLSNSNLNRLSGSVIPSFLLHQYNLRYVDLSDNKLEESFPSWLLQNNSELDRLYLSGNFFTGNLILPDFIHVLNVLDISSNMIDGKFPDGIGLFLPRLSILNISRNCFEDNLPSSLGELEELEYVDFSFNNFSGELPINLFVRSRRMNVINLSNNLLHGKIHLNLTNWLDLWILLLNNNEFNGTIEDGLVDIHKALAIFDISNNLISGRLPSWIKRLQNLKVLKVSDNYLDGYIPVELCEMDLYYLDISRNKFSGFVPSCLGNSSLKPLSLKNMQILLMARLQLEGEISMQLCTLTNLKIVDLSHNNFNGSIPLCLFEMPFWVTNSRDDTSLFDDINLAYVFGIAAFYYNINSTLDYFTFLSDHREAIAGYEVKFTTKGVSLSYKNNRFNYMTGLDLSNNKLSGQIPTQIEYLQALRSLNLSNNHLWGSIPSSISKMKLIESLDLSSNKLSGEIPSEIVCLNYLSTFYVLNNNLSGPTPNGGQFSDFDERNYGGNEYLCGPLLHRNCTSSAPSSTPSDEQRENQTSFEIAWFWWTFVASYIFVVVAWAIVIGINPRWCRGLFRMVDIVCLKLYSIIIKS